MGHGAISKNLPKSFLSLIDVHPSQYKSVLSVLTVLEDYEVLYKRQSTDNINALIFFVFVFDVPFT